MKRVLVLLILFLPVIGWGESILPKDVPRVRASLDPFYHEQGFRLGQILNYARDIFWSYEGQLMLGVASSPSVIYDGWCMSNNLPGAQAIRDPELRRSSIVGVQVKCRVDQNPWNFSATDSNLYTQFNKSGGGPMVLYYEREARRSEEVLATGRVPALWTNTRNYVSKMWQANSKAAIPKAYPLDHELTPLSDLIPFQSEITQGRVVKASMDGAFLKTYEITIQEANAGTNFKRLSVTDPQMFDYIVATMLANRLIRITFVDLFNFENRWQRMYPGYTTSLRILRAQVL